MIGESVVGGQLGLVHSSAPPTEYRVLVCGDHHPAAVGAAVDVRGGDALQPGTRRTADHAADVVVRDSGFLDGQAGFGERGINDLTFAGDGAPVRRSQFACAANIPARLSPGDNANRGGGPPGKPLRWRSPLAASATEA